MPEVIDELKAIERCARSRGTPACDHIANRLAAVLAKLMAEAERLEGERDEDHGDRCGRRYYADRAAQLETQSEQ